MSINIKKITSFFVVLMILIAAYVLSIKCDKLSSNVKELLTFLPYMLSAACIILCIWFHHSRVFFNCIFLVYVLIVLSSNSFITQPETVRQTFINAVSIIIPINILLFSIFKERGITSFWGVIKCLVILCEIIIIEMDKVSEAPLFLSNKEQLLGINNAEKFINIPTIASTLYILTAVLLITRFFIRYSEIEIAFIGVSIAFYILIHFTYLQDIILIFFSAIFLIIAITLLETSYSMAFKDQLTGILSRRALDQELLRLGSKYTIAMIDIDHFKKFNDRYGHKTGDDVLKMIASMIDRVGGAGKAFRYGGEEFTILFKRKDIKSVISHLENLRVSIENRPLVIRQKNRPKKKPRNSTRRTKSQKSVKITVSIGVAERNERVRTPEAVIKAADKALYKAKKTGRNKVSK